MRLVTQNVRKWHIPDWKKLCDRLDNHGSEILILTEYQASKKGKEARSYLLTLGYKF